MTINQLADQVLRSAVDNRINGEKFTKKRFIIYVERLMSAGPAIPHTLVLDIELPDGRWNFTVGHDPRSDDFRDGYDWWVPDTREDEARLVDHLMEACGMGR